MDRKLIGGLISLVGVAGLVVACSSATVSAGLDTPKPDAGHDSGSGSGSGTGGIDSGKGDTGSPPPVDGGQKDTSPPVDAGACCPVGYDLYSCTFPDGGAGHACHNPAEGCASSTTCGQGCDPVVTGTCGASCTGTAPNCFGNDTSQCCGQDPSGVAVCQNGGWLCGSAAAPGCNGNSCLQIDSGPACVGPAPNCFGNDITQCCGQDPSGPAVCQNGAWLCGTAAAPGCNGTQCIVGVDSGTCNGCAGGCGGVPGCSPGCGAGQLCCPWAGGACIPNDAGGCTAPGGVQCATPTPAGVCPNQCFP